MQTRTKQRLVGLLILLALLAIFMPLVFHNTRPSTDMHAIKIPPKPKVNISQQNNIEKRETVQLSTALIHAEASSDNINQRVAMTGTINNAESTTLKEHIRKDKAQTISEQKGLTRFMNAPKAWCVQLGTFRNVNNANALIKKLRKKGYDAYTRPILDKDGKHLLRVYVGPEIQKDSAIQLKEELKMSVHLNGVVRKYKVKTT